MADKLSIGLVTSPSEECDQMVRLLEGEGIEIRCHLLPAEVSSKQIEDNQLNVWLLNVNDNDWHDNIDLLLDESETSIYFNEPGSLAKQAYPEFWCKSLVSRLYEITGLTNDAPGNVSGVTQPNETVEASKENFTEKTASEPIDDLSFALDELESSAIDLPSDVAANLVSELESISPELNADLPELKLDSTIPQANNGVITEFTTIPESESGLVVASSPELDPTPEEDFSEYDSLGDASFDDLDFSNNNRPILESARNDLNNVLESSFSISGQGDSLDVDDDRKTEKTSTEVQTNQPQGMANFLSEDVEGVEHSEEKTSLDELPDDDLIEPGDLVLESLDQSLEAPVTGKVVYIETPDPEEPPVMSAQEDTLEEKLSGLSLEVIEKEKLSGKAVFIEEIELDRLPNTEIEDLAEEELSGLTLENKGSEAAAEQDEQESTEDAIADLDDGGLTLALDGRSSTNPSTSGRAEFLIDETEFDAISLEGLDEAPSREENQILQDTPATSEESAPAITQGSEESLALTEEGDQAMADAVEVFEIPMLEESVMDVDFDEPANLAPQEKPLTPCWVIGASLGGPAAVKRFFQSMPPDINACFVVVQHIDESFLPVMAEILTSNSHFDVEVANGSNAMQAGKVYLAPLKGKIVFLQDGSMLVDHSQKWSEPYSPCIDDVIRSMAPVYGELCGSIIFSGMGEDGLKGCEKLTAVGGSVWAQSADTCANPSMPNAVINANLASVVAAPEILADRLTKILSEAIYD